MTLTCKSITVYDKILHKAFDNDPTYSDPVAAKAAEMASAGKTDGVVYYLPDHVTIVRNWSTMEAANEWCEFVYDHNSDPAKDVTVIRSIVEDGVFTYPDGMDETARGTERAALAAAAKDA